MRKEDREAGMCMKKTSWMVALKEFYEPEDVGRYFDEVSKVKNFRGDMRIIPPEDFFTKEVLKKGMALYRAGQIDKLQSEVDYLRVIKIPELLEQIKTIEDEMVIV